MWRYILIILALGSFNLSSCGPKKNVDPKTATRLSTEKTIGVWIAAPQHNKILHSPANIEDGIKALHKLGVNTVFLCVWAENKTAFGSEVLLSNSNYGSLEATSFLASYEKQSGEDHVKLLIDAAQERDIRVIFWFEYGFMARVGGEPNGDNNPILAKHPHWIGIDHNGSPSNYNQSDYYFNAFHPEVQEFLLDLMWETLDKYPNADGLQGDDRLPASPADSGYDEWTRASYVSAFGEEPSLDFREDRWFNWRLDRLNEFAQRMYDLVKSKDSNYVMAFSPNPYPWCAENLMQDWPTWIENGNVELLNVQCYRRDFESYKNTVDQAWSYASAGLDKSQFVPGILLGISSEPLVEPNVLDQKLQYNLAQDFGGQSYFYVKWMIESDRFSDQFGKYHFE